MQNNRFYPHQREEDKGSLFDKKTLCTQTHKKIYSLKNNTPPNHPILIIVFYRTVHIRYN